MSNNILFKEKDEKLFWKNWREFTTNKNFAPRYLESTIKYYLSFIEDSIIFDKSFVYLTDNKPVAGVFLPIEKNNNNLTASFKGGYIDAPIYSDKLIEKKVFTIIDDIAVQNQIAKIMFSIEPLQGHSYSYLQEYSYLDTSILSYVFDLTKEDLLGSCRRNHKRNIKKIKNNIDFSVFYINKNNPSYEIHEEYRRLHHKCSGKITRPKKTFDLQYEQLKQGKAVLFGLKHKNKNIAYLYFIYNADKAISASAADDPDYDELPLYHILYYSGMKYLKKIGIRYIDTSQPSGPSAQINYYPDKKQLNIAHFKQGFGGSFKPYFRGIKYFSKSLFKKDIETFITDYNSIES